MSLLRRVLPGLLVCLIATPVLASSPSATSPSTKVSGSATVTPPVTTQYMNDTTTTSSVPATPNLVSFGAGWYDVTENTPRKQAVDVRAEYRWGTSLISSAFSSLKSWDRYAQLHPFAGIETSSRLQFFGLGGVALDVMLFENLILTPSFGAGLYGEGYGKDLGSVLEFRSQIELGYKFSNQTRTSIYYSGVSNFGLDDKDPSAKTLGIYLHVPTNVMFGR